MDRRHGAAGGGPRGVGAAGVAERGHVLRQRGDEAGAVAALEWSVAHDPRSAPDRVEPCRSSAAPARLHVPADLHRGEEEERIVGQPDVAGARRQERPVASSEQAPPVAPGGGGTPNRLRLVVGLHPAAARRAAEEPPAGAIGDDARRIRGRSRRLSAPSETGAAAAALPPPAAATCTPPPPPPPPPLPHRARPSDRRRRVLGRELRQLLVEPIQGDGKRRCRCSSSATSSAWGRRASLLTCASRRSRTCTASPAGRRWRRGASRRRLGTRRRPAAAPVLAEGTPPSRCYSVDRATSSDEREAAHAGGGAASRSAVLADGPGEGAPVVRAAAAPRPPPRPHVPSVRLSKAVEYWLYDDGANPEKKEEHGPPPPRDRASSLRQLAAQPQPPARWRWWSPASTRRATPCRSARRRGRTGFRSC